MVPKRNAGCAEDAIKTVGAVGAVGKMVVISCEKKCILRFILGFPVLVERFYGQKNFRQWGHFTPPHPIFRSATPLFPLRHSPFFIRPTADFTALFLNLLIKLWYVPQFDPEPSQHIKKHIW